MNPNTPVAPTADALAFDTTLEETAAQLDAIADDTLAQFSIEQALNNPDHDDSW